MSRYVLPLDDVEPSDVRRCGGKAAGLGELSRMGMRVPPGFCIIGDAFDYVLEANSLGAEIAEIASRLDFEDYADVDQKTNRIRSLITTAEIPEDLNREISDHHGGLVNGDNKFTAVRSSVAVKESDISSFPGMMDTYHYVLGEDGVRQKIVECWASLWTTRAAFARHQKQIPQEMGVIAPVIQLMVNSEVAGVLFTANPISKDTGEIVIESNWGLGESVVSGKSMNDFFVLDKDTLAVGQRQIAEKTVMVTMDTEKGSGRTEQPVPAELAKEPTLTNGRLAELGEAGKRIEDHFGFSADVEWAFSEETLFILQTRKIRGLDD
ncbi:MAG: PEP/pyruvate-binding domain-containing protein [Rhodospirillales bacterium]|jgi:pyruvate,water dikinase|nr:PEP/pyruvate-binding domain-containing protein [Rhodospirillales bacterium]MDP6642767.1 PEP/pyruvate-binding domain-containing protein [Rhodospirillales bacterium]MDP6841501.1 PEP/pyruvate-binding domain-containing protein [Rhodospirillales bacterium]|tara:strand:+ start:1991 stop:2959 length:969 start_codon:yes stop_codon:yes gene_type:complete